MVSWIILTIVPTRNPRISLVKNTHPTLYILKARLFSLTVQGLITKSLLYLNPEEKRLTSSSLTRLPLPPVKRGKRKKEGGSRTSMLFGEGLVAVFCKFPATGQNKKMPSPSDNRHMSIQKASSLYLSGNEG